MARTLLTPASVSATENAGGQTFWKQILPQKQIHYIDKNGKQQVIDFDENYLTDLSNSFHKNTLDQTPFLLADADNKHTMDPERFRAEVVDMRLSKDLPPEVDGSAGGLYAKIHFASRRAARAVMDNPRLGVSARIREGISTDSGTVVPRGIIHVLGTMHPQVSGMSPWQSVDLSIEGDGEILDLSDESFVEEKMAKNSTPLSISDRDSSSFTQEEIAAFSDEELNEFIIAHSGLTFDSNEDELEDEDENENEDEEDDDDAGTSEVEPKKTLVTAGADLSADVRQTIDLANAASVAANSRATEALRRMAQIQWDATRKSLTNEGVPPHLLDLAEPVLNRSDEMIIDLSNSEEDDVNVAEIVRGLLDATKGTIDLSNEIGHSGTFKIGSDEDPDKASLDMWPA